MAQKVTYRLRKKSRTYRYSNVKFSLDKQNFDQLQSNSQIKINPIQQNSSDNNNLNKIIRTQKDSLPEQQSDKLSTVCLFQNLIEKKQPILHTTHNFRTRLKKYSKNQEQKLEFNNTMKVLIPKNLIPNQIKDIKEPKKQIQQFLSDRNQLKKFHFLSHIGKGSFATVTLAIERSTQKQFAVKIYQKVALKDPQKIQNIRRQIKNLKELNHKNIIRLTHAIYDKKKIFLIMQYAGRHSLEGILRKKQKKNLIQTQAKKYFQQILEAVACCHKHNITHRDIKLQNILISQKNQIKLIDFGFSIMSKDKLSVFCGTPAYMAPEILAKINYEGQYVDIWACGVLLYVMIQGVYPFRGINQKQLYRNIRTGKYSFKEDILISNGAKRVISKMLKVVPSHRTTAAELLLDKWFLQ